MKAIIHCEQAIPWQPKRAAYFAEGFRTRGIEYDITADRFRHAEGFPVLLGTTCWRDIEADGGEFLLVDRCSFGDTEKFVSLVWNGHGGRGNHGHGPGDPSRWEAMGVVLEPWREGGSRQLLCGQTESYSPTWPNLDEWYAAVGGTHFRPHPAGQNPTTLPNYTGFDDVGLAITLNSSIGVQCVIDGIATQCWDEGAMAYDVSGGAFCEREPWAHWLAWTQWTDDEIKEGYPWDFLL